MITFGHSVATSSILQDTCILELVLVNLFELKSLLTRVEHGARKLDEALVGSVE